MSCSVYLAVSWLSAMEWVQDLWEDSLLTDKIQMDLVNTSVDLNIGNWSVAYIDSSVIDREKNHALNHFPNFEKIEKISFVSKFTTINNRQLLALNRHSFALLCC